MEEDSPTSDPILFPFQLSPEQARDLNALSADQWLQHCQNVRANAPRTQLEIDTFLSLPIKEIMRIFCAEVHCLTSLTPPPATSSTSTYTLPTPNLSTPIPRFPLLLSRVELDRFSGFSDAQFLAQAKELQKTLPTRKTTKMKAFLKLLSETIAASLKQAVQSLRLPKSKT